MNIDRPIFGRITIGSTRHSLGRADLPTMFVRAAQQLKLARVTDQIINIELSFAQLPDSNSLDKQVIVEQAFAANVIVDDDAESPFEGITVGRVREAMESPEYADYAILCDPEKRVGVNPEFIRRACAAYQTKFPDCFKHFPMWIES